MLSFWWNNEIETTLMNFLAVRSVGTLACDGCVDNLPYLRITTQCITTTKCRDRQWHVLYGTNHKLSLSDSIVFTISPFVSFIRVSREDGHSPSSAPTQRSLLSRKNNGWLAYHLAITIPYSFTLPTYMHPSKFKANPARHLFESIFSSEPRPFQVMFEETIHWYEPWAAHLPIMSIGQLLYLLLFIRLS